ncbi:MAG: DEAD/DEAH box helicase [Paracoccaceae bacterium]
MKNALRAALDDRGYTDLTPVQQAVLDPDLEGRDLLVSAQTGSGKTLGFGLAIAPTLLGEAEEFDAAAAPLALVIAPTRELALQVKRELAWLFAKAGGTVASCVGGMDMRDERRALERGAHIVAATPGRLRDHILRGSIDLSAVRAVVLDEADEMLDLGFREELEFILGEAPDARQTLLFSATVPPTIADLAKSYQKDAQRIVAKSDASQHADIEYRAMTVADRDIDNAVINTLRFHEAPNALVFANTRAMVNRLATRLSNRGFQAVVLSGELTQSERTHALQAMRDGRAQVCVATDVAARGIDLPKLDLVVHAELPSNAETLLHRSGRTGRAGRKGVSALIVTAKTRKKAERILGWAKVRATWGEAPSAAEVRARDEERLFADPSWQDEVAEDDLGMIERLVSTFSAEQLAAAYLRQLHTLRAPPEELSEIGAVDAKPAPRKEFGPSVWFAVSGGREAGAEPRRLLPMLCKAGNLTKDDIGAIRVRPDQSFVQIREASVPGFLAAVGDAMVLEEGATLTRLDTPPDLGRPAADRGKPARTPAPKKGYPKPRPAEDRPAAPRAGGTGTDRARAAQTGAPPRRYRRPWRAGAAAAHGRGRRTWRPAAQVLRQAWPQTVRHTERPPPRSASPAARRTVPGRQPRRPRAAPKPRYKARARGPARGWQGSRQRSRQGQVARQGRRQDRGPGRQETHSRLSLQPTRSRRRALSGRQRRGTSGPGRRILRGKGRRFRHRRGPPRAGGPRGPIGVVPHGRRPGLGPAPTGTAPTRKGEPPPAAHFPAPGPASGVAPQGAYP